MSGKSIKLKNKNNEEIYPYPYFPIGYVYISINNTNPSILFGGNWEQLKDRFLLGAGDNYSAGTKGGEKIHNLTIDEIPSHYHSTRSGAGANGAIDGLAPEDTPTSGYSRYYIKYNGVSNTIGRNITTAYTGGSQAHNNMPPYLVVYMWVRVS